MLAPAAGSDKEKLDVAMDAGGAVIGSSRETEFSGSVEAAVSAEADEPEPGSSSENAAAATGAAATTGTVTSGVAASGMTDDAGGAAVSVDAVEDALAEFETMVYSGVT